MPKDMDFTERIIPLFVIVMIGWVLILAGFGEVVITRTGNSSVIQSPALHLAYLWVTASRTSPIDVYVKTGNANLTIAAAPPAKEGTA